MTKLVPASAFKLCSALSIMFSIKNCANAFQNALFLSHVQRVKFGMPLTVNAFVRNSQSLAQELVSGILILAAASAFKQFYVSKASTLTISFASA